MEKTNEAYALAKISGLKYCEYLNRQYGTDGTRGSFSMSAKRQGSPVLSLSKEKMGYGSLIKTFWRTR